MDNPCGQCHGTGRYHWEPGEPLCLLCGGSGVAPSEARPHHQRRPGPLSPLLSVLFILSLIVFPLALIAIVLDWFKAVLAPLRTLMEALPASVGIVRVPGEEGQPWPVLAAAAVVYVGVIVVFVFLHRRTVKREEHFGDRLLAITWSTLVALLWIMALPALFSVYVVASGEDLTQPIGSPDLFTWPFILLVFGAALIMGWLATGRRLLKERTRSVMA